MRTHRGENDQNMRNAQDKASELRALVLKALNHGVVEHKGWQARKNFQACALVMVLDITASANGCPGAMGATTNTEDGGDLLGMDIRFSICLQFYLLTTGS